MRFQDKIHLSSKELKKTKAIVGCGLLAAIHILLDNYASFYLTPTLKFSMAYLAYGTCGYLYGPITAGVYGIVLDLLTYFIKPDGGFFIGYTFSAFVTGFLFGIVLYKDPLSLKRCFIAKFLVTLIINILLTPLWMDIMGWGTLGTLLTSTRLIKNIILLPLESIVLFALLKYMKRIAH